MPDRRGPRRRPGSAQVPGHRLRRPRLGAAGDHRLHVGEAESLAKRLAVGNDPRASRMLSPAFVREACDSVQNPRPVELRRPPPGARGGASAATAAPRVAFLRSPEPVSLDRLVDDGGGDQSPATAAHTVHVHVSAIRKLPHRGGRRAKPRSHTLRRGPGAARRCSKATFRRRSRDERREIEVLAATPGRVGGNADGDARADLIAINYDPGRSSAALSACGTATAAPALPTWPAVADRRDW